MLQDYLRCQEVCIVLPSDLTREVLGSQVIVIPLWRFRGELVGLLLQQPLRICLVYLFAFGSGYAVFAPLPQLASADLCSCCILLKSRILVSDTSTLTYHPYHQVVDWNTSDPSEPTFHISETDIQVLADALFSDGAWHVHVQKVIASHMDVFSSSKHLIGCRHVLVENLAGNCCQRWMRNPGSVMSCFYFTELVLIDIVHSSVIRFLVVLDRDLRSHSTLGVNQHLRTCSALYEEGLPWRARLAYGRF